MAKTEDRSSQLSDWEIHASECGANFYMATHRGFVLVWMWEDSTYFKLIANGTEYTRNVNRSYTAKGVTRAIKRWLWELNLEGKD